LTQCDGIDFLAFETIPCLIEAKAIAELLKDKFPNSLAWISFSCKNGNQISNGDNFSEAFEILKIFPQIFGIGINCTSPEYISSLLNKIPMINEKLIVVYPNSGEKFESETHKWSGEKFWQSHSHSITDILGDWKGKVNIIGGCCRTDPEFICILKEKMSS